MISEISPREGQEKVKNGAILIDVRTPKEFAEGHLSNSANIPYDQIPRRIVEVCDNKTREIVLYCHLGQRALVAQQFLAQLGYENVYAAGGLDDWLALEPLNS